MTRLGRWIDFENDYKTMDPSFMESVWWVFSQLWAKGLVYKGFKVRGAALQHDVQQPLALDFRPASTAAERFYREDAGDPAGNVHNSSAGAIWARVGGRVCN